MPETDERLDKVEERLGTVETGLKEVEQRLGSVETGLKGVDQRLGSVETGLKKVDRRLGSVETGLNDVRKEVGGLRGEVSRLQILGEKNTEDVKKVAEVQAYHGDKLDEHGRKLDQVIRALEPLNDVRDFIHRVAPNHETRIQELEKRTGIQE
jgi:chromosome segregation ATPase